MRTIRLGTFETNSSSTHSMVICSEEEYKKWANGELLASRWMDGFKTREEVMEEFKKEHSEYFDSEGNFISTDEYESLEELMDDYSYDVEWYDLDGWAGDLECDENSYTSPSGDKIRIICRYGYDG